ncbi:MAG: hypothetical protein ACREBD_08755 [Blastocatellia bacterium]
MARQKTQKLKQSETRSSSPTETKDSAEASRKWPNRIWLSSLVGALLIFLAIYLLRLDRVVGLFVDDAWYVLLAKSLATGQGYQLINSPLPGIHPFYPPVFPFLLSAAYRVLPQFPDNVWLLKSVSVVAMAGVGWASYRHFTRDRQWPRLCSLTSTITITMIPGLVFIATSAVMSECVFMLFQLLAVLAIEAGVRKESGGWRYVLLGAALVSAAFLTRSIGVGLIAAGGAYLLKERLWKSASVFATAVILFAGPWTIYSRLHAPTAEQRAHQGGMIVQDYTTQFWQRRAGNTSSGTIRPREIPDRLWSNATKIAGANMAMLFTPTFFRSTKLSGEEILERGDSTRGFSYFLSLLIIIGIAMNVRRRIALADLVVAFTLLITIAWPWDTFRFLMPLAPFLLFYLLDALRRVWELIRPKVQLQPAPSWQTVMTFASLLLALYLFDHVSYLRQRSDLSRAEHLPWQAIFDEHRAALDWIRERTPEDAVIASDNSAMVYIYTGRKSVAIDDPAGNWENWKRLNVRYMARLSIYPAPDPGLDEGRFYIAYRSKGPLKLRVADLGPKENRLPWSSLGPPAANKIETFK